MKDTGDVNPPPFCVCVCLFMCQHGVPVPHLPGSLHVPKVDVGNEEDRLGVQVRHALEQRVLSLLAGRRLP